MGGDLYKNCAVGPGDLAVLRSGALDRCWLVLDSFWLAFGSFWFAVGSFWARCGQPLARFGSCLARVAPFWLVWGLKAPRALLVRRPTGLAVVRPHPTPRSGASGGDLINLWQGPVGTRRTCL